MADLLSSAEKTSIQNALQDVRDTFGQDIHVYVKTKQAADWSSENPFYGTTNPTSSLSSQEELTKFTYKATVLYMDDQNQELFDGSAQANLPSSEGRVRIKVSSAANEKIKICERIEINDVLFVTDSDPKVVGPFSTQAFMWYLKREN